MVASTAQRFLLLLAPPAMLAPICQPSEMFVTTARIKVGSSILQSVNILSIEDNGALLSNAATKCKPMGSVGALAKNELTNPSYTRQEGAANPFNGVNVGDWASPSFVDDDNDGDMDLYVGNVAGEIWYYSKTR